MLESSTHPCFTKGIQQVINQMGSHQLPIHQVHQSLRLLRQMAHREKHQESRDSTGKTTGRISLLQHNHNLSQTRTEPPNEVTHCPIKEEAIEIACNFSMERDHNAKQDNHILAKPTPNKPSKINDLAASNPDSQHPDAMASRAIPVCHRSAQRLR